MGMPVKIRVVDTAQDVRVPGDVTWLEYEGGVRGLLYLLPCGREHCYGAIRFDSHVLESENPLTVSGSLVHRHDDSGNYTWHGWITKGWMHDAESPDKFVPPDPP